jgi:hypothetical protein
MIKLHCGFFYDRNSTDKRKKASIFSVTRVWGSITYLMNVGEGGGR